MKTSLLLALIMAAIVCSSSAASAVSYSITIQASASSYVGAATVSLSGQVSPAPGPSTAVFIRVFNPSDVLATAGEANVNGTTGLYDYSFVPGGSSLWTDGNYIVNATWGAYGSEISATVTFSWSSMVTTTTTTATASSTSTSSTTASTTTSSTSTSSTSTATSTSTTTTQSSTPSTSTSPTTSTSSASSSTATPGVPEFPYQGIAVAIFTVLVIASYLMVRQRSQSRVSPDRFP